MNFIESKTGIKIPESIKNELPNLVGQLPNLLDVKKGDKLKALGGMLKDSAVNVATDALNNNMPKLFAKLEEKGIKLPGPIKDGLTSAVTMLPGAIANTEGKNWQDKLKKIATASGKEFVKEAGQGFANMAADKVLPKAYEALEKRGIKIPDGLKDTISQSVKDLPS
jgi:hypothetical protein